MKKKFNDIKQNLTVISMNSIEEISQKKSSRERLKREQISKTKIKIIKVQPEML